MKRKALIVGVLLAVFSLGMIADADAHRRGYRRGHGHRYGPNRAWIAPQPPVIVISPGYGYRTRPYYGRPYRYQGYRQNRGYGHNWRGKGYGRGNGNGYGRGNGYDRRGGDYRRW